MYLDLSRILNVATYKLKLGCMMIYFIMSNTGPYMCQLNTDPMKSRMGILQVILHNVSNVTCRGCDEFFYYRFQKVMMIFLLIF